MNSGSPNEQVAVVHTIDAELESHKSAGPLLRVSDLTVALTLEDGRTGFPAAGLSFEIARGEVLGVLGESGAGKSTLALALLQLLPRCFSTVGGSIELNGRSLLPLDERAWQGVRGDEISTIYQDSGVLNPVMRVGDQVTEVLLSHREWSTRKCREEAKGVFQNVGLGDDPRLFAAYPHQLSGGQRQRVSIALALACSPSLIVADEPTASLDSETSAAILELFDGLRRDRQTSFLLISHSPAVLAAIADRILVMYAGEIVESGPTSQVFETPLHPYTRELLRCDPGSASKFDAGYKEAWAFIPGNPPDLVRMSVGCAFETRCSDRMEICGMCPPKVTRPAASRTVNCFAYGGHE